MKINDRWKIREKFYRHSRSDCYWGYVTDTESKKVHRMSTGIDRVSENAKEKTRKKAEKEAKQKIIDWIAEREQKEREKGEKMGARGKKSLFKDAFREWLGTKGCREVTLRDYTRDLTGVYAPLFGEMPVDEISFADIQKLLTKYKDHSRRTRQKHTIALRSFFEWAIDMNYASKNPCKKRRDQGEKKLRTKFALTVEQAERLLRACQEKLVVEVEASKQRKTRRKGWTQTYEPPEDLYTAVALTLYTGIRPPGNILALRWKHVDLAKKRIVVPADLFKTEEVFEVPIHPALERLLRRVLRKKKSVDSEAPVVSNLGSFGKSLCRASKRCGLEQELRKDPKIERNISPYDLRHTYCTWLETETPASWSIVKRLMGHTGGSDVTERYAHPSWEKLVAAIDALPDLLGEKKDKKAATA